eukprot:1161639-Pelagomonas_calceolata.AAC.5
MAVKHEHAALTGGTCKRTRAAIAGATHFDTGNLMHAALTDATHFDTGNLMHAALTDAAHKQTHAALTALTGVTPGYMPPGRCNNLTH